MAKIIYKRLGLKHIVIVCFMALYALLGGILFYELEAHADMAERQQSKQVREWAFDWRPMKSEFML